MSDEDKCQAAAVMSLEPSGHLKHTSAEDEPGNCSNALRGHLKLHEDKSQGNAVHRLALWKIQTEDKSQVNAVIS